VWRPPTTDEFDDNRLIELGKNKQKKLVRGESKGFAVLRNAGERSCMLTWIQQGDFKGIIPPTIMSLQMARALEAVTIARDKFSRDEEIARGEREKLMVVIRNDVDDEVYDYDESIMIA